MKKSGLVLGGVIVAAALVGGYFWWQQQEAPPAPVVQTAPAVEPPAAVTEAPPPVAAPPAIQHPVEEVPVEEPLPPVQSSDELLAKALQPLVGSEQWRFIFIPEMIVRHIVATVDNLPRQEVSTKVWPVRPAGSWLQTEGSGDDLHIAASNAQRYARYVELVQKIDIAKLAEVYRKYYPLFQRAYVDLGYPDGYFNDRLVVAIDDMLAAPEPAEPPQLVQNKVLYQFADADLESRSAGQKIMLRIGVDNERIVKQKLRALRAAITKTPPAPSTTPTASTAPATPAK